MKLLLLLLISCSTSFTHKDYPSISVMQGPTSTTQTSISILSPQKLKVKVIFTDKKGSLIPSENIKKFSYKKPHSPFIVNNYALKNLSETELYTVRITGINNIADTRTFKTLSTGVNKKILVASCMSDTYNDIGDIAWPNVFKNNPDLLFLIGDNIYADVYSDLYLGVPATPKHLWDRYINARIKLKLYHQRRLKPVFALWDDHDYGNNDGNKTYKYKKESLEIFNIFFARYENDTYKLGPGASSHLKVGKNNYYFIDARYYRDPNGGEYHLGKKVNNWLFNKISGNKNPNFLIKGDQFFGAYHTRESFGGNHPKAFKRFLKKLKNADTKVAFITGDRHFYELMEIEKSLLGYKTYEFTSSGIHAKTFKGTQAKEPNPRRIGGADGVYHFMTLDISNGFPLKLDMKVFNENNSILDNKTLQIH